MKHSAALSIAGAGTLWGLIGLFVNLLAAKGFAPLQITTLRVTIALLFTALIIWRTDIRQFFIRPKDWWMFFGNGVIGLVFFNWCYFNAIAGGSLAIAALLLYTAPVFVMLMSVILFHEKLTKEKIVALILTFVGCGCITGAFAGNLSVSRETFLYGLASGFGYALYSISASPPPSNIQPSRSASGVFSLPPPLPCPFPAWPLKLLCSATGWSGAVSLASG